MNIIKKIFRKKSKNNYGKHATYFQKKTKVYLVLASFVILAIGALIAVVAVRDSLAAGGGGDSLVTGDGGAHSGSCRTGNCFSSASWVKFSFTSNHKKISSLPGFMQSVAGSDTYIDGCGDYGGAYVYVYNIHNSSGFIGKWAGAVQWSTHKSWPKYAKHVNLTNAKAVSADTAKKAFKSPENHTGKTWGTGNFGWFCAYPTGTPPPPEEDTEVEGCVSGVSHDVSRYGEKTYAHSYVINRSESSTGGFKGKVYAKPGDTIQFCHDYQFGNRYVGRRNADSDGSSNKMTNSKLINEVKNGSSTGIAQKFRIRGLRDGQYKKAYRFADASAKVYLFGSDSSTAKEFGKWIKIPKSNNKRKPFNATDKGTGNKGYKEGNYWIVLKSPNKNTYKCNNFSAWLEPYKADGYQISGIKNTDFLTSSRSCKSGEKTTYNNVGHSISQEIEYEVVKGWVKEGYTVTGSCGCKNNSRNVKKKVYKSWSSFSSNSHKYGKPNYTGNGCNENGQCDCWDEDGDGTNDWCWVKYKNKSVSGTSFKTKFSKDSSTSKDRATAYIPYNFNTFLGNDIYGDVKFLGGSIDFSTSYTIEPRQNLTVAPNYDGSEGTGYYATITPKNSKYRVYELLLPENYDTNKLAGNMYSNVDVCSYFSGNTRCDKIAEKDGPFNKHGDYDGATAEDDKVKGLSFTRQIPDDNIYVGYKYCVASSIYPSSSHDSAANNDTNNSSGSAFSDNGNGKYNVSNLSCVTISKKPSFQVWGGGFYTKGSITTSISRKRVGGQYNTNYGTTGTDGIYGSWDEYMIIAGKNVNGMASGAAFGYNAGYAFGLSGGIAGTTTSLLTISPQTIANHKAGEANSANRKAGNSKITGIGNTMLKRLESRFRDKAKSMDSTSDNKMIIDSKTGAQYFYRNGNTSISEITDYAYTRTGNRTCDITNEQCTSTLTTIPSSYAGAPLSKGASNSYPKADNTLVIYVAGNLTIDRNICYGSATNCTNGQPAKLNSYADVRATSISAIPQVLIFADNVTISSNVDRVEAWIIMKRAATATGILKTCDVDSPNIHQCAKTLVVTGPIFAKKLQLKRTGGASYGTGSTTAGVLDRNLGTYGSDGYATDGSIAPAEIFNLRSDAYYWSFNQAQRSSEAVTTYVRELAPRY